MRSSYKVLHFDIAFFPKKSGSFYRLYNLISSAEKLEHIIVTNTIEGPESYQGIKLFRIRRSPSNIFKYYKLFFRYRPKSVIIHNSIIAIYLLPLLVFFRVHRVIEIHAVRKTGWIYNCINKALYRHLFDTVSVLSYAMKSYLVDNYGVSEDKIAVIYNGYESLPELRLDAAQKIVNNGYAKQRSAAYIGSLHDWQGIPDLLRAVKILKARNERNIMIEIVGGGPLSSHVKSFIKEHMLEGYVKYHGEVKKEDLPEIISGIDLLLIPRPSTVSTETIVPLKVFEYITYHRPILMSDVGGLTEILEPGCECMTYRAGDSEDLATKISLLIHDDHLMEKLHTSALKKLNIYNDWRLQALYYEEVILNGIG